MHSCALETDSVAIFVDIDCLSGFMAQNTKDGDYVDDDDDDGSDYEDDANDLNNEFSYYMNCLLDNFQPKWQLKSSSYLMYFCNDLIICASSFDFILIR